MLKYSTFQPKEPIVPERLREARLARGYSIQEIADKTSVKKQSISKYELGFNEPPSDKLAVLSEELDVPISFFYKPIPPSSNRSATFFRSLKTNSAKAKDVMLTKSKWAYELVSYIANEVNFPSVNIPTLPTEFEDHETFTYEEIEIIAEHVRMSWGLGVLPIPNLAYTIEKNGIIIISINSGYNETDACSCIIDKQPFIFMDTHKECAVRSRFNLAHELAHLLMHKGIQQSEINNKKVLERIEREANQFASCFLLPRNPFLSDVRSTSIDSFLPLKKKWRVSISAMVHRCNDLNIFSESQYIYIQKQISSKRWRKNEPYDQEWSCEIPIVLKKALQMLIDRGDINKDHIINKFRLNTDDIIEICSLPKDYFQEIDKVISIDFTNKAIN